MGGAGSAVAYALLTAGVKALDLVDVDPVRCAARTAELAQTVDAHGQKVGPITRTTAAFRERSGCQRLRERWRA